MWKEIYAESAYWFICISVSGVSSIISSFPEMAGGGGVQNVSDPHTPPPKEKPEKRLHRSIVCVPVSVRNRGNSVSDFPEVPETEKCWGL